MTIVDREYAEALYLLAAESGSVEAYRSALHEILELIEAEEQYMDFLSSPAISLEERYAAIDEAFAEHYEEYLVSFLKLLCQNGRISSLSSCVSEFDQIVRHLSGHAVASVTSAVELSEEQKTNLIEKLSLSTGKKLDAVFAVCPELLAGVKVEIEGKTYDGTLLRKLRDVKDVMSR